MENALFFDLLKKIKHLFTPYYINFGLCVKIKKYNNNKSKSISIL